MGNKLQNVGLEAKITHDNLELKRTLHDLNNFIQYIVGFLEIGGIESVDILNNVKSYIDKLNNIIRKSDDILNRKESENLNILCNKSKRYYGYVILSDIRELFIDIKKQLSNNEFRCEKENLKAIAEDKLDSSLIYLNNLLDSTTKKNKEVININDLVYNVVEFSRHTFNDYNFLTSYHKNPLNVLVFKEYIDSVFLNLIKNATYASSESRILTIETKLILENYKKYGLVNIEDKGVGISSNILDKIFYPFFTTKGDNGTGLGLYSAKKIIESEGGFIKVKSKEGIGTVFGVYLPLFDEYKKDIGLEKFEIIN